MTSTAGMASLVYGFIRAAEEQLPGYRSDVTLQSVEKVAEFFPDRGPKVSISERIAADERRENRFCQSARKSDP